MRLKKIVSGILATAASASLVLPMFPASAPAATLYKVAFNPAEHGTANVLFDNSFTSGQMVYLTATPDKGYKLTDWEVISGIASINNNRFVMQSTVVLKPVFKPAASSSFVAAPDAINKDTDNDYVPDVNVDANGDGKADTNIDIDGDGMADLNICSPVRGTSGEASWISKTGDYYCYPAWNDSTKHSRATNTIGVGTYEGVTINYDSDGDQWPDTNIDYNNDGIPDMNLQMFSVNVLSAGGGRAGVVGSTKILAGQSVNLLYSPDKDYEFSGWSSPVTIENSMFTMPWADVTITATFKDKYGNEAQGASSSSSSGKSSSSSVKTKSYTYTLTDGEKKKVSRFRYEDEDEAVYDVSYSSTGIATLSTDGTIRAKDEGSTIITLVKADGIYKIKVKVKEKKKSSSSTYSRNITDLNRDMRVGNDPSFTYIKKASSSSVRKDDSSASASSSSSSSSSKSSSSSALSDEELLKSSSSSSARNPFLRDISSLIPKGRNKAGEDNNIEVTYSSSAKRSKTSAESNPDISVPQQQGTTISGIMSTLLQGDIFPFVLLMIPGLILLLVLLIYFVFIKRR